MIDLVNPCNTHHARSSLHRKEVISMNDINYDTFGVSGEVIISPNNDKPICG